MRSTVKVMTQKRGPPRSKYVILWCVSESRFTVHYSTWASVCVDDTWLCWWQFVSLVRQWSQSSVWNRGSGCWCLMMRIPSIRMVVVNKKCRVAVYCDLGWRMFGVPWAGGYKWQYILIAAFLVYFILQVLKLLVNISSQFTALSSVLLLVGIQLQYLII